MWLIDILESFGELNLAPFAIGGASVVFLITLAMIYSAHRRRPGNDIEDDYDYEEHVEETESLDEREPATL